MNRKATLVVNTHSRKGRKLFFRALDLLTKAGVEIEASYPVHDPSRLPSIVKEALDRDSKLVIVGGGDGTISSVVDAFAHHDAVLGLLPLGTSNNFVTRTMKIPSTIEGAVDVIVNGEVTDVDLGKANGDYFANTASIGLTADIARATPRWLKKRLGPLAYAITGVRNLITRERFTCTLTLPDGTHTVRTHQVMIANGNYFGMTRLAPDEHIDSGQLIAFTMETLDRWQMAKAWVEFFFGRPEKKIGTHYHVTSQVTIVADPPQYLNVDGEVTAMTPVTFTVARNALRVMTPRQASSTDEVRPPTSS